MVHNTRPRWGVSTCGGGWMHAASDCRAGSCVYTIPDLAPGSGYVGLRVARVRLGAPFFEVKTLRGRVSQAVFEVASPVAALDLLDRTARPWWRYW